ncbi:uncharacterized protein LOC131629460 [Vicia villosa]|uniref:uncharacterized protein LOC131629460 n=1 Tax=Vicia villosa TaxID=3911 RepID=UPI00273B80DE|nr:uncharacterized protein LOC131629460 [Vicia villosa]
MPDRGREDDSWWTPNGDGTFSVRSCYDYLSVNSLGSIFSPEREKALKLAWKALIPFRYKAFAWRILIDRLPSKNLLFVRGILSSPSDLFCDFCKDSEESIAHLFFSCVVARKVWGFILEWLEMDLVLLPLVWENFLLVYEGLRRKKVRKGTESLVWIAVCWGLWRTRNKVIFGNDSWSVPDLVWSIKVMIWKWSFHGEIMYGKCNFYDFCKDPLHFLS